MPGWARKHFALIVTFIIVTGVLLRVNLTPVDPAASAQSERYRPVAAAIGLTQQVPADAALATWINSGLYTVHYAALTFVSPDTSIVDFCARFLADPEGFSFIAHAAALIATAISIYLVWLLVSRLLDPVAGLAAAFILAIHPTAIAFTSGISSGAFCLLFLLCGLSIAARADWANARTLDIAAIGLSFGFAIDAIPFAAPLLLVVIVLGFRATPSKQRLNRVAQFALGVTCFGLATTAVVPERVPMIEKQHIVALSTIVVVALLVATYALRSLRELVGDTTYSSIVLSMALIVGLFAMNHLSPVPPSATRSPGTLACGWLISNAPDDSSIIVHRNLASSVPVPRSAKSWQRQYHATHAANRAMRLYSRAARKAAAQLTGPRFDVVYALDRDMLAAPAEAPALAAPHYLVLPDTCDPHRFGSHDFWFVARFRSDDPDQPGITIWGTQAAPNAEPVHVEWRMGGGRMLAARPAN